MKNNPFFSSSLIGLALVLTSLLMMIYGTPGGTNIVMPIGFSTPILALEFATSNTQISDLVASLSEEDISLLITSVNLDMVFMVVYNLFLFTVLITISKIIRKPFYYNIAFLAWVVLLADLSENIQLLNGLNSEGVNIFILQLSTWIKWMLLAFLMLIIGRFLMTTGRIYDKILGLASYIPLPLWILSFFSPGFTNELFAGMFFLLFPMLIIYTWFSGIKPTAS